MRGRALWRESPNSSLCVLCAERLIATRLPSQVQRRYIQVSRPSSKPPATATAEVNGETAVEWPISLNSERAPNQWGRPAFGQGRTVATADKLSGSSGFGRPAFGKPVIRLTDEEKKARDTLAQKELKRPLIRKTHTQTPMNGFDNSRTTQANGHTPQPLVRKHLSGDSVAGFDQPYPSRATDQSRTPWNAANHNQSSTNRGLDTRANGPPPSQRREEEESSWGQLRRKTNVPQEKRDQSAYDNKFARGREEREAQARTKQYTPLIARTNQGIKPFSQDLMHWDPNNTRSGFLPNSANAAPEPLRTQSPLTNELPSSPVSSRSISLDEPAVVDGSKNIVERVEPQPQKKTRWAEELPKGKDRDKAKRRQKFASRHDEEDEEALEAASKAEMKKKRKADKAARKAAAPVMIMLPEYISVSNLATALRVRFEDFVDKMEELGFEDTSSDHILNGENAGLIAMEFNFEPIIDRGDADDLKARPPPEDPSILPQRPPVVTIMGHVDHGKTTLLDCLRKSSVAASEHGGITQHIGAFSVPMPSGKIITFLDTPGHSAFLSMRQRGANVTDIVILVVAADDSVKPQTIEAIKHAKAAKVPIIVAINKIDKEEANIERVKQDLARHDVEVEDYGGDTQVVCVSGKTEQGMGELEETVIALSEIIDMRAEIDGPAEGWVLEASIKPVGKVATVLVRRGTMRPGDFIVAGNTWARIRCLRNEAGVEIQSAGPGTPVEIDGWREQPLAGDEVLQAQDESKAKSAIDYRLEMAEREKMAADMDAINDARKAETNKRAEEKRLAELETVKDGEEVESAATVEEPSGPKQVYFIVKGDVSGSVEAVLDSITVLGNKEVQPCILRSGVGQLSEFDVEHAAIAKGYLINFNTTVDPSIAGLAERSKVEIMDHNIIYKLVDEVRARLSEQLSPAVSQKVLGEAEVAQVFEITVKGRKQKAIAGCKVRNGTILRTEKVRVMRKGKKIFDGSLDSLKNVKKDAMEMRKGSECGMGFENWSDFEVGDQIQSYETKEEKRYL